MTNFLLSDYQALLEPIATFIGDSALDKNLEQRLNTRFPANGDVYNAILTASKAGIEAGVLCKHDAQGIKFGRIIKPCDELNGFSVDVVEMTSVVGPHHRHPNGEIDLIMPLTPSAKFDECSAGWLVYGPDSAHCPTVTNGEAIILYLLPSGAIEFSRN